MPHLVLWSFWPLNHLRRSMSCLYLLYLITLAPLSSCALFLPISPTETFARYKCNSANLTHEGYIYHFVISLQLTIAYSSPFTQLTMNLQCISPFSLSHSCSDLIKTLQCPDPIGAGPLSNINGPSSSVLTEGRSRSSTRQRRYLPCSSMALSHLLVWTHSQRSISLIN